MRSAFHHTQFNRLLLALVAAALLSGCFKARLAVEVNPNESGTISAALGMTQQARAFVASSGGEDPFQNITQTLGDSSESENVTVRRWTEGEYEWVEAGRPFTSLSELNKHVSNLSMFESFSLRREPGLLKDRFVLDAQLNPLTSENEATATDIDPTGFFEFQISVKLPGDVIETNGAFDGQKSSTIVWTISNDKAINMHAVSESWNTTNIALVVGVGLMIPVAGLLVGSAIWFTARQRNPNQLPAPARTGSRITGSAVPSHRTVAQSSVPNSGMPVPYSERRSAAPDKLLSAIGARSLLIEVNKRWLSDLGTLEETPNGLRLWWIAVPGSGVHRELVVKVVDSNSIMVNDMPFPATYEGVKRGILAALREMNNR